MEYARRIIMVIIMLCDWVDWLDILAHRVEQTPANGKIVQRYVLSVLFLVDFTFFRIILGH